MFCKHEEGEGGWRQLAGGGHVRSQHSRPEGPSAARNSGATPGAGVSQASAMDAEFVQVRHPVPKTTFGWKDLQAATKTWTPKMKDIITDLRLETLEMIRLEGNVDRLCAMMVMNSIDLDTMSMDLFDRGVLHLTPDLCSNILGFHRNGARRVPVGKSASKQHLLAVAKNVLALRGARTNYIPVSSLREIVHNASEDDLVGERRRRLKVAYTMLACATFLAPTRAAPSVSDEVLHLCRDPDLIGEYDMGLYVYEILVVGARKVQRCLPMDPGSVQVEGCLLVVQVTSVFGCQISCLSIHYCWDPHPV